MFIGQYNHSIDDKNRLIIPAKYREKLGSKAIISLGYDGSLALFSESQFEKKLAELQSYSSTRSDVRTLNRLFSTTASECEFDKLGRIVIPAFLLKELNCDKDIILVGVVDHIEIWSKENWEKYFSNSKSRLEDISEKL